MTTTITRNPLSRIIAVSAIAFGLSLGCVADTEDEWYGDDLVERKYALDGPGYEDEFDEEELDDQECEGAMAFDGTCGKTKKKAHTVPDPCGETVPGEGDTCPMSACFVEMEDVTDGCVAYTCANKSDDDPVQECEGSINALGSCRAPDSSCRDVGT